jgi:hypothetical protein
MTARCLSFRRVTASLVIACLLAAPLSAVELHQKSIETFNRYIRLTEARIAAEIQKPDPFLWVDSLSEPARAPFYERLRRGEVLIEKMNTLENGQPIKDDDALIHHWLGTVFVPGVTLQQTIDLAQHYELQAEIYKPDVMQAKILSRDGNDFKVFFRFFKKKAMVSTVYNTVNEVRYIPIDARRLHTRTWTTRVAQVEDHNNPDGPEKPIGNDSGYLWRLNSYWRYLERDGGVYIQLESITLSRDIPALVAWIVRPFVEAVPRESVAFTLGTTRKALMERHSSNAAKKTSDE